MCGIIGLIDPRRRQAERFSLLRDAMMNRGPDGWGEFTENGVQMAMRRLAIIDLEQGHQPFFSRHDEVVTFQNGEIYNYLALKKELEALGNSFRSNSDTEVLAHGYAEWGIEGLLKRLDGMYAFAIYDRRQRVLHLARDPFGEKPLFISQGPGCFAYASSLIPLAALPWVELTIEPTALEYYLALHYVPGNLTMLRGVQRLLPGERLELYIPDMSITRHQYFVLNLGKLQPLSTDEAHHLIEEAVVSRLVSDVPVGIFLSGGVDSSLIGAIAAKHAPGIHTFSIGFTEDQYDESAYAQTVANHISSNHTVYRFDLEAFNSLLPEVANALDEPLGDQAMLPVYWLSREANRHVKVVLSGEGADELFGGYGYYSRYSSENVHNTTPLNYLIANGQLTTPSGFPLLSDSLLRRRLTGKPPSPIPEWEEGLIRELANSASYLQRAQATDIHTWLPNDLLVKLDRMTMANSLEGRAPYLNAKLAQAAVCALDEQRVQPNMNKVVLRQVAERWLPIDIVYRPKQGFVLPMGSWLHYWIDAHGGSEYYFAQVDSLGLSPKDTAALVKADRGKGIQQVRLVFAIVLLIEWYQRAMRKITALRQATA